MDRQIYSERFRWSTPEVGNCHRKESRNLGLKAAQPCEMRNFECQTHPKELIESGNTSK